MCSGKVNLNIYPSVTPGQTSSADKDDVTRSKAHEQRLRPKTVAIKRSGCEFWRLNVFILTWVMLTRTVTTQETKCECGGAFLE